MAIHQSHLFGEFELRFYRERLRRIVWIRMIGDIFSRCTIGKLLRGHLSDITICLCWYRCFYARYT